MGQDELTPRELQVLRIMAEDKTAKQIAKLLGISEDGVNSHIAHIKSKLGVNTKPGVVCKAIRLHMISLWGEN